MRNLTCELRPILLTLRFGQLGGKGYATKVRVGADGEPFSVFDFRTFLTHCGSGSNGSNDHAIKLIIENWHHTIGIICNMPPHPNIISPTTTFVMIKDPNSGDCGTPVGCGCLYPFLSKRDVRARIKASNKVWQKNAVTAHSAMVCICYQTHTSCRAHIPHG